ncbi:MAG: hypothetical protein AAFR07_05710 [Pseudomonadota bacterium]
MLKMLDHIATMPREFKTKSIERGRESELSVGRWSECEAKFAVTHITHEELDAIVYRSNGQRKISELIFRQRGDDPDLWMFSPLKLGKNYVIRSANLEITLPGGLIKITDATLTDLQFHLSLEAPGQVAFTFKATFRHTDSHLKQLATWFGESCRLTIRSDEHGQQDMKLSHHDEEPELDLH